MNYQWTKGSHVNGDPQIIGKELERLQLNYDGKLKPQIILAEAKKKKSPLHKCFEWDDSLAAEQYRLQQASYLLRVIVHTISMDDTEITVRCFVNIKDDEANNKQDRVYVPLLDAFSDPATAKEVFKDAKDDLGEIARKIEIYHKIHNEIGKAVKHIRRAQESLLPTYT